MPIELLPPPHFDPPPPCRMQLLECSSHHRETLKDQSHHAVNSQTLDVPYYMYADVCNGLDVCAAVALIESSVLFRICTICADAKAIRVQKLDFFSC
jgi:hypothetical protein